MKAKTACEIAIACNLTSKQEMLNNIFIHATSLFILEEINTEIKELMDDLDNHPDCYNNPVRGDSKCAENCNHTFCYYK